MTDQHPITPPPELMQQWWDGTHGALYEFEAVVTQSARWGADQELEACVEWMKTHLHSGPNLSKQLRTARRPKLPSLAEQALNELDLVPTHDQDGRSIDADTSVIRRALERLQELEHND